MTSWMSVMNAGTSRFAEGASCASFHAAGTATLCNAAMPWSIAPWFMETTFSPFLPYDFTTASFRYSTAVSIGMMFASLKNADCMTMLKRPPRPRPFAMSTALTV